MGVGDDLATKLMEVAEHECAPAIEGSPGGRNIMSAAASSAAALSRTAPVRVRRRL